ncbi:hypothetical protein SAMN04488518_107202 [Pseudovibrio ascidiaceicola]|uniref:Uncharacterized protein n=1 Tax=Pseudovibrio ascidiaceicola TaxID=285279 RepID=A0A1I4BAG0_9HYPH|nr:hypothetical protein SAMN04488518_107202 [Pseudovibrio ascidiaceicola]
MTVAVLWGSTSSGSASCRRAGRSEDPVSSVIRDEVEIWFSHRTSLAWGNRLRLTKLIPLTQKLPYPESRAHAFGQEWTVHSAAWVGLGCWYEVTYRVGRSGEAPYPFEATVV